MDVNQLIEDAKWVRRQVLEVIAGAGKGHIGGSFSIADILVALYRGGGINVDSKNPKWENRDRLIFSKGHSCESLYATLCLSGFISEPTLKSYGKNGSILGGHPDHKIPGVEISSGSLGMGLGIASGRALDGKMKNASHRVVAILGDGECYEGSVWEAAMFAAHHELGNLIAIVDRNREITLDETENCTRLEPFADKWKSFGWETVNVNGHDMKALVKLFGELKNRKSSKPLAVIADTVKGKGVSFMEQEVGWHHNVPKGDKLEIARKELAS